MGWIDWLVGPGEKRNGRNWDDGVTLESTGGNQSGWQDDGKRKSEVRFSDETTLGNVQTVTMDLAACEG